MGAEFLNSARQLIGGPSVELVKALRPNHHHRRANGANDDGGASARTRTDYHSSSSDDSSADSSHRNIQDKGHYRRVRLICQSNRRPSTSGATKRRAQAPTELGENIFSCKLTC
jgi:hypothetical protein